jgi:hypothetical protein
MPTLDEILSLLGVPHGAEDDPLELTSLQVLMLVEEIEASASFVLPAKEIRRDAFGTRRALRAFLASKGLSC